MTDKRVGEVSEVLRDGARAPLGCGCLLQRVSVCSRDAVLVVPEYGCPIHAQVLYRETEARIDKLLVGYEVTPHENHPHLYLCTERYASGRAASRWCREPDALSWIAEQRDRMGE